MGYRIIFKKQKETSLILFVVSVYMITFIFCRAIGAKIKMDSSFFSVYLCVYF